MEQNRLLWTAILVFSVFLASVSQILLKISANKTYKGVLWEYANPRVLGAYAILLGTTLISVLALRIVPLYMAAAVEAVSQVFVALLSKVVLKERINYQKAIGLAVIIVGILLVCL